MFKIFIAAALFAGSAQAQDLPEMGQFLTSLDGTEVSARANIGYLRGLRGSDIIIRLDGMPSGIEAQAALPREQLAAIEDCEAREYEMRCNADIKAELTFSDGRIFATIFDVQNVTRP
jgi:hypothetical protein